MFFTGQTLKTLSAKDLEELLARQIQESDTIEYKQQMYGSSDEDKREMLRDITAFANNRGGHLLIGIVADEGGIPTLIAGVESGTHVERITSSCLDNLEPRIIGLDVAEVKLSNQKVIVIVAIPESFNAPHMITFKGLNQFWKRHGRQKEKMTVWELQEAFEKRLRQIDRLEGFLLARRAKVLEAIGSTPSMVMSCCPAFLRQEEMWNVLDRGFRLVVSQGQGKINCGTPYPTLSGIRADNSDPYWDDNPSRVTEYLEVFRSGYIEYSLGFPHRKEDDSVFASLHDIPYIVDFAQFVRRLYQMYLPMTPLLVRFSIYNAKGMWLAAESHRSEERNVRCQQQHLEIEHIYVHDLSQDAKLLPKRICDRLWQAFHRDRCPFFDDEGNYKSR